MILLTGATGTVGRHLVLELRTASVPFRVLARDPAKARAALGPVDAVAGDLSRPETLAAALKGVDATFLLSPLEPALASWEAGFARAAKAAGVRRLVKLSALGAKPLAKTAIARWHGDAEEEVRRSGVPFIFLRPAAFYQNLLQNAASLRRGTLAAPMGTARVAMVDARDVAAAAAAALTGNVRDGETLTLTGPTPQTYAELAAAFAEATGRPVHYSDVEPAAALRGMLEAGAPAWLADAVLELAADFREGRADLATSDVRLSTGREPTPFSRFLRDHASAFA